MPPSNAERRQDDDVHPVLTLITSAPMSRKRIILPADNVRAYLTGQEKKILGQSNLIMAPLKPPEKTFLYLSEQRPQQMTE